MQRLRFARSAPAFQFCLRRDSIARLERLTDAEVKAPLANLGFAVHQETWNRVELVAEIETDRADRCLVSQTRSDRVPQIVEVILPVAFPDIAAVEKEYGTKASTQRQPRKLQRVRPSRTRPDAEIEPPDRAVLVFVRL